MPEFSFKPEINLEKEKIEPVITVYLLRHGESDKDKSNSKRGLTDRGREQVQHSFGKIIDQTISEELPEFNQWDDPAAKKEAAKKAFANIEVHLRDSGTDRTIEQTWVEYDQLKSLGVENAIMPDAAYKWKGEELKDEIKKPGIAKRLRGVGGVDQNPDFRKKIDSPEYQREVGATDEITAWALTPEDKLPKGVESKKQMEQRFEKDLKLVESFAAKKQGYPKKIMVIANSHASIITLGASAELRIPLEGEVENAEGLRFDFYGDKSHTTKPFGEKIEEKVKTTTK